MTGVVATRRPRPKWRHELGAFPGYANELVSHMLRVIRNHARAARGESRRGYEGLAIKPPVPLDHAVEMPGTRILVERPPPTPWNDRAVARREARLPQRTGDRDRADRHDRPRDGLRHDRHRARFRAGEVQEARRRRLLQDHQPRCRTRLRALGYWRGADRRSDRSTMPSAAARSPGARRQPRGAAAQKASADKQLARRSRRPGLRLRHQVRLQQMDARRGVLLNGRARIEAENGWIAPDFDLLPEIGFGEGRDRRPPTSILPAAR